MENEPPNEPGLCQIPIKLSESPKIPSQKDVAIPSLDLQNIQVNSGPVTPKISAPILMPSKSIKHPQTSRIIEKRFQPSEKLRSSVNKSIKSLLKTDANPDQILITQVNVEDLSIKDDVIENVNPHQIEIIDQQIPAPEEALKEEISQVWQSFEKTHNAPPDLVDDLLRYASHLSYEAIEAEDYDTAEQIENDIKLLKELFKVEAPRPIVNSQTYENRLEEVKQDISNSEQIWKEKIESIKEKERQKLVQLEAKHKKEKEDYEERCQSPEFLLKFSKASSGLQQMWKLQHALAAQHDFEGAKEMQKRAKAQQKKETQLAQKRAIECIQQGYATLEERQEREMRCAQQLSKRKIKEAELQMEKELATKRKRENQVRLRLQEEQNRENLSTKQARPQSKRIAARRVARREDTKAVVLDVQIKPHVQKPKSVLSKRQKKLE